MNHLKSELGNPLCQHALVSRGGLVSQAKATLAEGGLAWLCAATGMGKTIAARVIALAIGGNWLGVNLKGLISDDLSVALTALPQDFVNERPSGVILDDLEIRDEPRSIDAFQRLVDVAKRLDLPIIVTSSAPPNSKVEFGNSSKGSPEIRVPEFGESEVASLITVRGGEAKTWSRYVYLASGSGHPQLVEALTKNLSDRKWPTSEFKTLQAIMEGNPAVEKVRAECRIRLLQELQPDSLAILQRLSLFIGPFDRSLATVVGGVAPAVKNASLLIDALVGSWLDQLGPKRFRVSPLLANLGGQTLSLNEQKLIHGSIADHLTGGRSFSASDANAAVTSAMIARNSGAMTRVCMATIRASEDDLEILGQQIVVLPILQTESLIWPEDPKLGLMIRGVQLLLTKGQKRRDGFSDRLTAFDREVAAVNEPVMTALFRVVIYTKLLITSAKYRWATPGFIALIAQLHKELDVISSQSDLGMDWSAFEQQGISTAAFAFIMQMQNVLRIEELPGIFADISSLLPELREELFRPLTLPDFKADTLIRTAWLMENDAGTLRDSHADVFLELAVTAEIVWRREDIAAACYRYAALVIDEHAGDKSRALQILNEALRKYPGCRSELLRAKAKVYFRAAENAATVALATEIFADPAGVDAIERAFLGREAGIAAEIVRDFASSRNFYLCGRAAAQESPGPEMTPLAVGLLADAAVASWQMGDREQGVLDFITVLQEITTLDPRSSLQAAHCKAVGMHAVLWMYEQTSHRNIKLSDGNVPQVLPGFVSNPNPHKEIGEHIKAPIAISWYMLAAIECDGGLPKLVFEQLDHYLPNGRCLEGEFILYGSRQRGALLTLDAAEFCAATIRMLGATLELSSGRMKMGDTRAGQTTKGVFPQPTRESLQPANNMAEMYVLLFSGLAAIRGNVSAFQALRAELSNSILLAKESPIVAALNGMLRSPSFESSLATRIVEEIDRVQTGDAIEPKLCWLLANAIVQTAAMVGELEQTFYSLSNWLRPLWAEIMQTQRFRLSSPSLHSSAIEAAVNAKSDSASYVIGLLKATLPATGLANQGQAIHGMDEILTKFRSTSRL